MAVQNECGISDPRPFQSDSGHRAWTSITQGAKIFLALAAIEYIIPAIMLAIAGDVAPYKWPHNRPEVWLIWSGCVTAIGVVSLLARCPPTQFTAGTTRGMKALEAVSALLAVVLLVAKLVVPMNWRYIAASMSETGDMFFMFIANDIAQSCVPIVFWWLLCIHPDALLRREPRCIALRALLCADLILSVNGLGTSMNVAPYLACVALPRVCLPWLLRIPAPEARDSKKPLRPAVAAALIGVIAVAIAFIGMQSKTTDGMKPRNWLVHLSPEYLVGRLSTHQAVTMATIAYGLDAPDWGSLFSRQTAIQLNELQFRLAALGVLEPMGARPDMLSISRFCVVNFARYHPNSREGTSPGLIGAMSLYFPPPMNALMVAIATGIGILCLNKLLRGPWPLTWLGCFLFAFRQLGVWSTSPLEFVTIINTSGISLAFVAMIFLLERRKVSASDGRGAHPGAGVREGWRLEPVLQSDEGPLKAVPRN